ncbi:MAG: hypothetical protein PHU42_04330 [Patescibacteria group bacterium]|nr:hypothetical protein [Patescibacteria group bacterium]
MKENIERMPKTKGDFAREIATLAGFFRSLPLLSKGEEIDPKEEIRKIAVKFLEDKTLRDKNSNTDKIKDGLMHLQNEVDKYLIPHLIDQINNLFLEILFYFDLSVNNTSNDKLNLIISRSIKTVKETKNKINDIANLIEKIEISFTRKDDFYQHLNKNFPNLKIGPTLPLSILLHRIADNIPEEPAKDVHKTAAILYRLNQPIVNEEAKKNYL